SVCDARPADPFSGLKWIRWKNLGDEGRNTRTRNTVSASAVRRSRTLEDSAASGSSQITYHGITQARLAISATVAQPALAIQSPRRRISSTTATISARLANIRTP